MGYSTEGRELGAEGDSRLASGQNPAVPKPAESRQYPVRVIRAGEGLGIPRQICRNHLHLRRRQEEKPVQSGQGQDWTQAELDDGSGEHPGQGLSWDELLSQGAESAWVSCRGGSSDPIFAGLFAQLSPWLCCLSQHSPAAAPDEHPGERRPPVQSLGALWPVTDTWWSVVRLLRIVLHVLCLGS